VTLLPGQSTQRGGASAPPRWVEGTTPYPWPFDGRIEPATLALLVLSVRGDWMSFWAGGPAQDAIETLRVATLAFGGRVVPITTTDPSGRLTPRVPSPSSRISVDAVGWDGFYGTGLDAQLRYWGVTHLLLAGAPLETAVHSTMRSANDRGYECLLVADATAAIEPHLMPRTLSMVEMSGGIFGAVGHTDAVVAALTS
jgi:biuret amidohydrolase